MKSLLFKLTSTIIGILMVQLLLIPEAISGTGVPSDGGIDRALCATYSVYFDSYAPGSVVFPNSNGESTNGDLGVDISGGEDEMITVSFTLPTLLTGSGGSHAPISFPGSGPGSGVHIETGGFFNPNVANMFSLGPGGTCNLRLGYTVTIPLNSGEAYTGQVIITIDGSPVACTITVNAVGCLNECIGNIVMNGTFIEGLVSGQMPPSGSASVAHWTTSYEHPTVFGAVGCGDSGFIGMWGNKKYGEAIQQTLATPIKKGRSYRATICYAWGNDPAKKNYIRFKLRASNTQLTGPTGGTIIGVTPNYSSTSWTTVTLPVWTADNDYSILTIGPENNANVMRPESTSWGYIDNVCLQLIEKTTGPPVSHVQRWFIPTDPNIQGLAVEEPPEKLPLNAWFTELDQEKIGRLQMPKLNSDCNFASLKEWELHWIDTLIPARPFKIAYSKPVFKITSITKATPTVWYTDTNRNTVNGIFNNSKLTSGIVYSYKIDSSIGHPWDIQVQGKVKYTYLTNATKNTIRCNPKIWFSVHPKRNQLFALDPTSSTATLETYTIPYGTIDAFFVDAAVPNSAEHIWIAASDTTATYYYRMSVLGSNVLMWSMPDTLPAFNSLRPLHNTKKFRYQDQLPYQLWALGNTPDGLGAVRIVQFNTSVVNVSVTDQYCKMQKGYYNGPNGLFAPSSKSSITLNRMFITEGLGEKDTLRSNRAAPSDTIRRQLVSINRATSPLQPVLKAVTITTRRVKPLCEVLNWTSSESDCIVEQWKAYEPPPSFDFSTAYLDIDMTGNYAFLKGSSSKNIPDMEQFNFAFHEPRPGNFGIVGRITYTAGLPINGVIDDTYPIPRQRFDENGNELPNDFQLFNAYPNPFNPTTTLRFAIPTAARIILNVYNILGQEVYSLYDAEILEAGYREVTFEAGNLASGVYYYRLIAQPLQTDEYSKGTFTDVKKMLLVR